MLQKILVFLIISELMVGSAVARHIYPEKYYQTQWCGKWHGVQEYRLKDNTRIDCVTKNYAVEFDFAPKWAEGFGQAKYYGEMTGKKPAVILIIEKPADWKHYNRLKTIAAKNGVTLWYVKSPDYDKTDKELPINYNVDTLDLYFKNLVFKSYK